MSLEVDGKGGVFYFQSVTRKDDNYNFFSPFATPSIHFVCKSPFISTIKSRTGPFCCTRSPHAPRTRTADKASGACKLDRSREFVDKHKERNNRPEQKRLARENNEPLNNRPAVSKEIICNCKFMR